MKKILIPFFLLFSLMLAAQTPSLYESGVVTFQMPEAWTSAKYPGLQYDIVAGPKSNGFMQNIVIAEEAYDGDLESYIVASKGTMLTAIEACVVVSEEPFAPDSGVESWKMVFENVQYGHRLRQYFYIFRYPGRYFIASCTVLAEEDAQLGDLFDTAMKTFSVREE